jgi:hypothetical protein
MVVRGRATVGLRSSVCCLQRSMRIRTVVRSGSTLSSRLDMSARISINPLPRPRFAGRGPLQRPLFDTTRISLSSSLAPRIVTRPFACSIPFAAASWMASTTASLCLAGTSTLSSHAARSCRSRRRRDRSGGSEASNGSTYNGVSRAARKQNASGGCFASSLRARHRVGDPRLSALGAECFFS